MHPAFRIPLSPSDLQLLGEISVIQGQIEYLINEATATILGLPLETIELVYGPATLSTRMTKFILYAQKVLDTPGFSEDLAALKSEIDGLAEKRNDFAHAIFGFSYPGIGKGRLLEATDAAGLSSIMMYTNVESGTDQNPPTPIAYRTARNAKRADPAELPALRERFAYASLLAGRLWHRLDPAAFARSTWREIPSPQGDPAK